MKRFPGQSRDIWLDTGHGMLERSIMFVVACCHVHITHARALLLLTATCVERCEKDISWCWHWSENRHFAAISESEPGDITKVVAGSSDPFFASGFDESIVYCRQSYSDLSRGLVTTDQSGSSFFEDSYISHFFVKNLLGYHPSKSICGVFINDLTTEQTCHKGIVTRPYTFWIRFPFPCGVFFKLMF